jgi:hypothetical protein
MKDRGKQLEEQAKELFDESVEKLDAATLSRLNQGRHKALEELHRPGVVKWHGPLWGAPAAGVFAVAVVAAIVMRGPASVDAIDDPVTASDFEMLLEADSLEMLEDLEFYSLLDAVDAETNGNVG